MIIFNFKSEKESFLFGHKNDPLILINSLNQTIFQINENNQWAYLNDEWEKLTGFSISETLGKDILQRIHPDDKEQCVEFIQNIYKSDSTSSSSLRTRILTRDERLCWVNIRANTYINPKNNKTYLVGVISDITERVREYGLHQATHRTLYTLINNLCGLVYRGRNDRDWTMEFVSEGCFDLTGYRPSELINRTVTFGSLINPNDQDLVWTNVQSALQENRSYELNYRIQTSNHQEKWVWERGKGNFSSNGELLSIEGFIVDITDYRRNKQKENEEILYKTKTKLPQKHLFLDRLSSAIIKNNVVDNYNYALLIIYIDRFKKLQERFSADVIDKILIDVSKKINSVISSTSSFCQFGDGEFGLLLEHIESINTVRTVVKHIHDVLLTPVKIDGTETYLTVSTGVYVSTGASDSRKVAINNTYTALNRAKSLGGGRYEIYDEVVNAKVYALDRMEKEIFHALEKDELNVFYQPIVNIDRNSTLNFEARLFWEHPRIGRVSSDFFSDVRNNTEIVVHLNQWLMATVADHIQFWESQAAFNKRLNISAQFFGDPVLDKDFLLDIERQLLSMPCGKSGFSIGLSEKNILSFQQNQIEVISRLHQKGLHLILHADKFTLPSSEALFTLPIDTVKMHCPADISENKKALNIAKAQIDYIHALEKKIIINQVDTETQYSLTRELNCDFIQGKAVSPELDKNDILEIYATPDVNHFQASRAPRTIRRGSDIS